MKRHWSIYIRLPPGFSNATKYDSYQIPHCVRNDKATPGYTEISDAPGRYTGFVVVIWHESAG
ncbi:MAG: hypothetical protein QOH93_2459 [Chloroflexia bacterium]|jgi:hypothetical protein|nr:hypothetical protein [Chloroflexia bacterium]